jgi:VWFA-related protein
MNGRRAVVVLTDGQDNQLFNPRRGARDDAAFQRTLTSVQAARTPVYFVALDTDKNPGSGTFASQTMLKEARTRMELLAGVSGGAVFFPKGMRDIVGIYDQVSQDLGSSYTIAYTSSKPSVPGQTHRIEVRVHGASVKQSRDAYVTP